MKKKTYIAPKCEAYHLNMEAPILAGSAFTGRKLRQYDEADFEDDEYYARGLWFD